MFEEEEDYGFFFFCINGVHLDGKQRTRQSTRHFFFFFSE